MRSNGELGRTAEVDEIELCVCVHRVLEKEKRECLC